MNSTFQTKYDEFVEDLFGALPEYTVQITAAKNVEASLRLSQFQESVKIGLDDSVKNPGTILPGVVVSDTLWETLSENTRKKICEYLRVLTICGMMENSGSKPEWMNDAMNDIKKKLGEIDLESIMKKFMEFMKPGSGGPGGPGGGPDFDFKKMFENGFPKIPEKFLKGHMAKLAQEIVKDITPEDLGISKEMMDDCEKNPSRAFDILFQVFGKNPEILQKTVQKIGNRLQHKITSGAIKPQEIAREAEELMKEFSENSSFVDMLSGLKKAFGFEDMDLARQAGKEGSARLSIVKNRLKKKASEKEARKGLSISSSTDALADASKADVAKADAMMAALIKEENKPKRKNKQSKV